MAARNTDDTNKRMIARYVECQNYSQVAREFGVSDNTVRRRVAKEPDVTKKVEEKKQQNVLDMFDFMDAKKMDVQEFIELGLAAMKDKRKLEKAGVQSIATAIGIVLDKYIQISKARETDTTESELLRSLLDLERGKRG